AHSRALPSFPTRRSSDLGGGGYSPANGWVTEASEKHHIVPPERSQYLAEIAETIREYDRKVEESARAAEEAQHLLAAAELTDDRSEEHTSELQSREKLVC